jgi:hypothetical protein
MKFKHCALLLLMLLCFAQIHAQDSRCDADEGKAVASLDELPAQVQYLLGRAKTGTSGISDMGGKFNPSDVIIDATVPMRRLVSGVISHHCIWLIVEYGGIGHYQKRLEYRRTENVWLQVAGAGIERAPLLAPATAH